MGNRQSVQHDVYRRRSLVKEELDFPQPTWDLCGDDWEVYHVEVELSTLSPHTPHKVKVRLHEYTQEIISCEEECAGDNNAFRVDRDNILVDHDIISGNRDKVSVNHNKISADRDKFSPNHDKISPDQDKLSDDQDEDSKKKAPDEGGWTTSRCRDSPAASAGRDLATTGDVRRLPSSTRCSRCRRLLSDQHSPGDVSRWKKNPDTGLSQDSATSQSPTAVQREEGRGRASVCNDSATSTHVPESEDAGGRASEGNDMFLQWHLSLEEPRGGEGGQRKGGNAKRRCGVSAPCSQGLQHYYGKSWSSSVPSHAASSLEHRDHETTYVIPTSSTETSSNVTDAKSTFELRDDKAVSEITSSSTPTSSDPTDASPASNAALSPVTSSEQRSPSRALSPVSPSEQRSPSRALSPVTPSEQRSPSRALSPALCVACSASATQLAARSSPRAIPACSRPRPSLRAARRKLSDPVPALCTTPLASPKHYSTSLGSPSRHSKQRRVSLKGEPGWIPNPLDSDQEDSQDTEDSGVFSDTTQCSPSSPGTQAVAGAQDGPSWLSGRAEDDAPRLACPEPPLKEVPTAAELARKRLGLQTGRRRYNSEPTPVAPETSSSSSSPSSSSSSDWEGHWPGGKDSSCCSVSEGGKSGAGWRLVRLVWGRGRAGKTDTPPPPPPPPPPPAASDKEKEEEDLEEQLEWMRKVTDSEPPTPSEDRQALDFPTQHASSLNPPPARRVTFSQPPPLPSPSQAQSHTSTTHSHTSTLHQPSTTHSHTSTLVQPSTTHSHTSTLDQPSTTHSHTSTLVQASQSQPPRQPAPLEDPGDADGSPAGQELELDWLCEPEWNNFELELFWSVLRPHMERLLQSAETDTLPRPCAPLAAMDAADHKMLDRCLLHVQWHIWKGNYCQAVSDFRAVRRHFRCCAESHLIQSETRDDVENLRLVFQRKRPSRFRFWI